MATTAIFEKLTLKSPHLTYKQFIPALIYGTAWKKDATSDLVYQALCNGFTGIDTANQPKHYREDLVGAGLNRAIAEDKVKRSDIYLQTKFTPIGGQDLNNLPYNAGSSITEQVQASIESSLQHFETKHSQGELDADEASYIDAVVLHSPLSSIDETMEAWRTLETYVPSKVRNLGISNCNLFTLMDIYGRASIKPSVVQNRFYSTTKFDIGLRKFCRDKSIIYQSFWTLTANPTLLWSVEVGQLADRLRISQQAALYCFVLGLGNTVILNGTKNLNHMREDLAAVNLVGNFAAEHKEEWDTLLAGFCKQIGQVEP